MKPFLIIMTILSLSPLQASTETIILKASQQFSVDTSMHRIEVLCVSPQNNASEKIAPCGGFLFKNMCATIVAPKKLLIKLNPFQSLEVFCLDPDRPDFNPKDLIPHNVLLFP